MVICDQIDDFILKYKLDRQYPRFKKNTQAKQILMKTFGELASEDRIILIGLCKEDMEYVCECIPNIKRDVKRVLWEGTQEQLASIIQMQGKKYAVSQNGKDKMLKNLRDSGVELTDIYELFEKSALFFEDEFYRILPQKSSFRSWDNDNDYKWDELYQMEYSENIRLYKDEKRSYIKSLYAEKCAFLAIWMRDFILFKECAELAIEHSSDIDFRGLIDELDRYLAECERKIKERKAEDIITFWIDAVPYGETGNMCFWNEIKDKAVSFERAYAVTPNTKPVFRTMFCEKKEITDEGYKIRKVDEKNSSLIRMLKSNDYEIKTISGYFGDIAKETEIKKVFGFRAPTSLILWHMLMQLMDTAEKQFIICHFFAETHYPYLSMEINGYDNAESVRRTAGEKKTDNQLRYYSSFFPPHASFIYMSDHGKGGHIKTHHINIDVVANGLKPKKNSCLVSTLDYCRIVKCLIEKRTEIEVDKERISVPVETLDYYSEKSTLTLFEKKILLEPYQFGYIGNIYRDYLGLCFSNGIKWAVSIKKSSDAVPDSYISQQAVGVSEEVIENILDFPYGILKDEKFIYARLQHYLYDLYQMRIKERLQEIERVLMNYRDREVAIRTGGIHSLKLYEMLSPEIRKRICCFVDDNANCLCKRNGKLVLSKDAFREKFSHCTAILLSSYEHIKELREEAFHGEFGTCEIIDIYKLFDEKGIRYEKDFYYALYESDYQEAIRNINKDLCV